MDMSQTVYPDQQTAKIMIMVVGLQISVLGVQFSDYLLLLGAALTFSVVVEQALF